MSTDRTRISATAVIAACCLSLAGEIANATTWYVDNAAAVSGNGRTWSTPWKRFAGIAWNSVEPGDVIYISGGPAGSLKTYSEPLVVAKPGAPGKPIVIAVDAGNQAHCGSVIFDGAYFQLNSHISLNGNVGGQRHIEIRNFFNASNADFGNAIVAASTTGVTVDSIRTYNVNNAVRIQNATGFTIRNCSFEACRGDAAIKAQSATGKGWDVNIVENNYIESAVDKATCYGPDGIQCGNNLAIRNNVFHVVQVGYATSGQHCDYIQTEGGRYLNIHGNRFWNIGDSAIDCDPNASNYRLEHWRIWNNIFQITETVDPYPEYIRIYNNGGHYKSIEDIAICNNLFADNANRQAFLLTWGASPLTPVTVSHFEIKNNTFVGCGGPIWIDSCPGLEMSSFAFANNVLSDGSFRFLGKTYSAASWSAVEPTRMIGTPKFVSYGPGRKSNDFHLQPSDTIAASRGLILSHPFAVDADGVSRPQSSPWCVGPYEVKHASLRPADRWQ